MAKSPQPRPIYQQQNYYNPTYPRHYLTRSHYTFACHKASAGKAPGPNIIPNEIFKCLRKSAHDLIFQVFKIIAKHNYTPQKWCTRATKLIYKPQKTDPHNPSYYRPIALMNCILKLWASILAH
jgi:hypothetical protein